MPSIPDIEYLDLDVTIEPCWSCGNETKVIEDSMPQSGQKFYHIGCETDGCHGNWITNEHIYWDLHLAIEKWNTRYIDGSTSDGYHTFDELYNHRSMLFIALIHSTLRNSHTETLAFKSKKHFEGDMYEGMFIAGLRTKEGWATYHFENKWWDKLHCRELEYAPKWDGHTPDDAILRIANEYDLKDHDWHKAGEDLKHGRSATVFTSMPPKYQWICSKCGKITYVPCSDEPIKYGCTK